MGTGQEHGTQGPGDRHQASLRSAARRPDAAGVGDLAFDQGVQQRLPVAHVPVDGRHRHAQLRRQFAHAQLPDALLLDDAQGGVDHSLPGDRRRGTDHAIAPMRPFTTC